MRNQKILTLFVIGLTSISSLFLTGFAKAQEVVEKYAVIEFDTKGNIEITDAGVIVADWLMSDIEVPGRIIETILTHKTLEARKYGSISVDPTTGTKKFVWDSDGYEKLGRDYEADKIITGNLVEWEGRYTVTGRIIDIATNTVYPKGKEKARSSQEVEEAVGRLAQLLSQGLILPPEIQELERRVDELEESTSERAKPIEDALRKQIIDHLRETEGIINQIGNLNKKVDNLNNKVDTLEGWVKENRYIIDSIKAVIPLPNRKPSWEIGGLIGYSIPTSSDFSERNKTATSFALFAKYNIIKSGEAKSFTAFSLASQKFDSKQDTMGQHLNLTSFNLHFGGYVTPEWSIDLGLGIYSFKHRDNYFGASIGNTVKLPIAIRYIDHGISFLLIARYNVIYAEKRSPVDQTIQYANFQIGISYSFR